MKIKTLVLVLAFCCASLSAGVVSSFPQTPSKTAVSPVLRPEKYRQTDLYFGRSKRGGGEVTDNEWQNFLTRIVTPEFPDGLTVIEAFGQFRNDQGNVIREKSFILILLYPKRQSREMSHRIEKLRQAYIREFDQQSVMRVDLPSSVRVSF